MNSREFRWKFQKTIWYSQQNQENMVSVKEEDTVIKKEQAMLEIQEMGWIK